MRTQWNDDENDALLKLPWRARIVYLQGLRWHMDYKTGTVGMSGHVMSYQKLSEVLDCTETVSTKPDPRVNKEGLRAIFKMLERVGLVEWVKHDGKGLFFRLLLADTDQSAKNKDNPKTTPRQPQKDNPENTSNGKDLSETNNPSATLCCTREDNPPPESGIRDSNGSTERGAKKPKTTARGARLSLSELPDTWRQWCVQNRPDIDPELTWAKFRDYWASQPGQKGRKADWLATWRNWCRNERSGPRQASSQQPQSKADRIAAANRAAGDEFVNGDRIIQGQFRRVQQ